MQIFDLLPVLKKLLSSVSSICETANGLTLTLEHCEDKKVNFFISSNSLSTVSKGCLPYANEIGLPEGMDRMVKVMEAVFLLPRHTI